MRYLLRNVCWARRLRNGSLSTKIFNSLALFSEREWLLRACEHALSCWPRFCCGFTNVIDFVRLYQCLLSSNDNAWECVYCNDALFVTEKSFRLTCITKCNHHHLHHYNIMRRFRPPKQLETWWQRCLLKNKHLSEIWKSVFYRK